MTKEKKQSPFGLGWKLAAGFLALAVVVVVVVVFLVPRGEEEAPPPTPLPSTSTDESASDDATAAAGECPDLSTDTALPVEAPETTWEPGPDNIAYPISQEHGPAVRDGERWRCFSRTPTGALFAAPSLLGRLSIMDETAVADGPNKEALVQLSRDGQGSDGETLVWEGFRVISATADQATIEYRTSQPSGEMVISMMLTWDEEADDWKISASSSPPGLNYFAPRENVSYISWR